MLDPSDDLLRINGLFDHCHFFKSNGFPAKSITVWFNFTSWHLSSVMFWWQTELVWNINSNAINILNSGSKKEGAQLVGIWVTFDFYRNTGMFIVLLTFSSCIPQMAFSSSSSIQTQTKWWFWNKFSICILLDLFVFFMRTQLFYTTTKCLFGFVYNSVKMKILIVEIDYRSLMMSFSKSLMAKLAIFLSCFFLKSSAIFFRVCFWIFQQRLSCHSLWVSLHLLLQ